MRTNIHTRRKGTKYSPQSPNYSPKAKFIKDTEAFVKKSDRTFSFSHVGSLDDAMIKAFVDGVQPNCMLEDLSFMNVLLDDRRAEMLFSGLQKKSSCLGKLKKINISGNDLSPAGVVSLCKFVEKLDALQEITIRSSKLDNVSAHDLGVAIGKNKNICKVDLGVNKINDSGLGRYLEILAHPSHKLKELVVICNDVSDAMQNKISYHMARKDMIVKKNNKLNVGLKEKLASVNGR